MTALWRSRTKVSWYSDPVLRHQRLGKHPPQQPQYLPNLSGTKEVPVQGRGGRKQLLFCTGGPVFVESWL